MFRFNLLLSLAAAAALGVAVVFACGPFFGIEVLHNREQSLLAPPSISFEAELKALVPPPQHKLPVVEATGSDQNEPNRATVEAKELPAPVLAGVSAMWQQPSAQAAYVVGQNLPPAIQLYTAGALSFNHDEREAAKAYFKKILALPEQERRTRELWAHFMLGRIATQQANQAEAAAQFIAVRNLVSRGTPDQLGLAVASFGEQARGAWRQQAVADAVELYAEQASYGSQSGANSLVKIARLILKDPVLLDQAIQNPLARRLIFICLNGNSSRPFFVASDPNVNPASQVDRVVAALQRHKLTQVEGAGLLSSAAYSQGRFNLAQKLSVLEDTPMSAWVQAKLALRRGDSQTAIQEYDRALKIFQPALGDPTAMHAEYAVVQVSRSDYLQALDFFFRATAQDWKQNSEWNGFADYWGDTAYLAERVLTIEELRHYLDGTLPRNSASRSTGQSESSRLRSILARRLMRAGRRREARRYFDDPKIRAEAEQYDSALRKANGWWRFSLTRAEAWFRAATLARHSGMELLGFEMEPDFAIWNGQLEAYDPSDDIRVIEPRVNGVPLQKARNLYRSEDEQKRVADSKPERNVRFQYRLTGVDEAMKAADFLPPRSQAFAAVLCEASRWIIDRQPQRAEQLYRRYLRQGAYVPWGGTFGRTCPAPNFAEASAWSAASRRANHLARHARVHPVYTSVLAVLSASALAALFVFVRTRRA